MFQKKDPLHLYLGNRLSYGIVFLSLVIILGSVYNLVQIQNEVNRNFTDKFLDEAKNIEKEMTWWLVEDINLLRNVSDILSNFDYNDLGYARAYNKYFKFNNQRNNLDAMYLGLEDGNFLNGSDWVAPKTYDPRVRPWYIAANKASKPVIGDLYIDSSTQKYIFTISMPFMTHDLVKGVTGIDVYLETIANRFKSILSGTEFKAVIFDGQGVVVYYTGDAYIAGHKATEFKNAQVSQLYDLYLKGKSNKQGWQKVEGNSLILMNTIQNSDWGIVIYSDQNISMDQANEGIQQHFVINGLLLVLAFFSIYSFYSMDTRLKKNQVSMAHKMQELSEAHAMIEDINKQLESKSYTDGLTHVYNRRYFEDVLERYWSQAEKEKKQVGLAIIDVDHFKKYNDLYGHAAGDQILTKLCRDMNKVLEPKFILSRFGGEEFAVLAYDIELEEMLETCKRLNTSILESAYPHEGTELQLVTVSIGLNVIHPEEAVSIGDFIHMADHALYEAKMSGRNSIIHYVKKS